MTINSGKTAEIHEFLTHFCDQAAPPGYAVLVDAPWGAGKTFFIRRFLDERGRRLKSAEPLEGPTYFYASLFGVRTIEEIREQFFNQAHPVLGSPLARALGSGLLGVLEKHTGFKTDKSVTVEKLTGEIKTGVVVFDDLERAAIPPAEALGIINSFVEHGNFRVIVIANQSKMLPSTEGLSESSPGERDYQQQREKVIGRVLSVSADPGEVLDSLVEGLANPAARGAVQANRELVLLVFREGGRPNLRTLRSVLEDFDRLVTTVSPALAASGPALRALLAYMLAAAIEYRQGLSAQALRDLLTPRAMLVLSGMKEDPKRTAARVQREKYSEVEWNDPVVPRDALVTLFVSGVIDKANIDAHLARHVLVSGPRPSPAWSRLWHWHSYGQGEYAKAKSDVLAELSVSQIVHPGVLMHVIGLALSLRGYGEKLVERPETYFRSYIEAIAEAGTLEPDLQPFEGVLTDSWGGLGYAQHDSPAFRKLKDQLLAAVRAASQARMKASAPTLLADLRNDPKAASRLDEHDAEGSLATKPILHEINPADFAALLVVDGQISRDLIGPLLRRYAHGTSTCDLLIEAPWISKLRTALKQIARTLDPPFDKALRQVIDHYFDAIEKSLSDTRTYCERHGDQSKSPKSKTRKVQKVV